MYKRKFTPIAISCVLLLIAMGFLFVKHSGRTTPNTNADKFDYAAELTDTHPIETNSVTIQNYTFSPTVIKVKKGKTVIWTNGDMTTHTIKGPKNLAGLQSERLGNGASYSYVFDEPGEYIYQCGEHNTFGKVIVVE